MSPFRVLVICATTVFATIPLVSAESKCTVAGAVQCSLDCSEVQYCSSVGAPPVSTETCSSGKFCKVLNESYADCSADTCIPKSGDFPVNCTGIGVYPDPYNCSVTYRCEKENEYPSQTCVCGRLSYFDIKDQTCYIKDENAGKTCCRTTTPECKSEGQTGCLTLHDTENCGEQPNSCYICTLENNVLVAQPMKCPEDATICDSNSNPSTTTSRGRVGDFTIWKNIREIKPKLDPTCSMYIPPSDGGEDDDTGIECSNVGEYIEDPDDCHSYFACTAGDPPTLHHRRCPDEWHFECIIWGQVQFCGCGVGDCTNP